MGRHANGSKRRKRRKLREHITLRAACAFALVRLGRVGHNNVFSAHELATAMGRNAMASVNWHAQARIAIAMAWWDGEVETMHTDSFTLVSTIAETKEHRAWLNGAQLLQCADNWSPMFVEAIQSTCPYPKHDARVLVDIVAKHQGRHWSLW